MAALHHPSYQGLAGEPGPRFAAEGGGFQVPQSINRGGMLHVKETLPKRYVLRKEARHPHRERWFGKT